MGLDCYKCDKNPELQKYRGCLSPTEKPQYVMKDGTKLYRCPSKIIRKDVKLYIDWYHDFKNGFLPFPGTKNEQPMKLMQIFDIIEMEQRKAAEEKNQLLSRVVESSKGPLDSKRKHGR